MGNIDLGKVKKKHPFRPIYTTVSSKVPRISKLKLSLLLLFLLISAFGVKEFYGEIKAFMQHFYVSAKARDMTKQNLNLSDDVVSITNTIPQPSQVLAVNTFRPVAPFKTEMETTDKRAFVFDQYFEQNNSPLVGTGKYFAYYCDKYGAPHDCIIAVAIARNESDLCKYYASAAMHNCWGFGGGGIYRTNFNSFEEGIDQVTQTLTQKYGNKYIIDPTLMQDTFCGPDAVCANWGASIKYFISDIDSFSQRIGMGSLLALRNQ